MATSINAPEATAVGMGQIVLARDPDTLTAVLGSCIGLALYHRRLRVAAMAHIVLPDSGGRDAPPGKFANTALPHMIDLLAAEGAERGGLVARLVGGASMFGASGPLQIGPANAEAVVALLRESRIPIEAQHIGGSKGRRITLESSTGQIRLEIAGFPTETL